MSEIQTRRERLTVLGSTGSIGKNTLDVAARHPDRFIGIHLYIEPIKNGRKQYKQRTQNEVGNFHCTHIQFRTRA